MAYGLAVGYANAIMNSLLRAVAFTVPAAVWAQLCIGDPGAAGTANPSSVTTRQQVTFSAATNGAVVISGTPSWGAWGGTSPETIQGLALWTASTVGTFIGSVPLNSLVVVTTGTPLTLPTFTVTWVPVAA